METPAVQRQLSRRVSNVPFPEWVSPNELSGCTWAVGKPKSDAPHTFEKYPPEAPKILPNILWHTVQTPMVKLNKIPKEEGIKCEILGKCEYFNAGGSVKDRIGVRMIEEAERDGRLRPGMTLIEPTSGNTGIAVALASAIKGYRCIIVMPDKMSNEKVNTMRALGAEIVRTPTEASFDSAESHIAIAQRLHRDIPDSLILDQYRNPGNPLAHYDQTAEEILDQCDGQVDMVVAGTGTGGTITGIARKFKEKCPGCKIVGVDPVGSVLSSFESLVGEGTSGYFEVEGIGYDFVPTVLDQIVVDEWIKVEDKDTFVMARRLIKEEGLLCGGSSGSNLWGAIQAAKQLKEGQRCVVILPDSIRNYMTKFLNDSWMAERGYLDVEEVEAQKNWWFRLPASRLPLTTPVTIGPELPCSAAIEIMQRERFDQLPVIDDQGMVMGVVSLGNLLSNLISDKLSASSPVRQVLYRRCKLIHLDTPLGLLSRLLDTDHFVIVVHQQKQYKEAEVEKKEVIIGLLTRIDLLNFIAENAPKD